MRLFVVDPHPIFRRGLAASLALMEPIDDVTHVASPEDAWGRAELYDADLVVLDSAVDGGLEFISTVRAATDAAVLVCTADTSDDKMFSAIQGGANGFVSKEEVTHENLHAALLALASGASVVGHGFLERVMSGAAEPEPAGERERTPVVVLAEREQAVLTLIADGLPTREIAAQLCYSERTVKNVLHDVVTKLGVRSRSQAVAHAVREGLI